METQTTKLPSKKALAIIIVIISLVTASIITFGGKTTQKTISKVGSIVASNKITIPDNPDWQKEIESSYNSNSLEGVSVNESVVDNLSQSLISNYISLKQSNEYNAENRDALVNDAILYINNSQKKDPEPINLNLVQDKGWISMSAYGERLGLSLFNSLNTNPQNEIDIISKILNNENKEEINKLKVVISAYKNLESNLLEMQVPTDFIEAHTDMLLGLRNITIGLEDISMVFEDPIKSLVGLQLYQEGGLKFSEALQATIKYIRDSNYDYKQGSGGYYLLNGL